MRIGSVVAPGPVVNCEITRSSIESVKASIQPETIAGEQHPEDGEDHGDDLGAEGHAGGGVLG